MPQKRFLAVSYTECPRIWKSTYIRFERINAMVGYHTACMQRVGARPGSNGLRIFLFCGPIPSVVIR
jgi:hypothetical protein